MSLSITCFYNLYLKVQDRAASLEYCPWCTSKGLIYSLRSYCINLQESITLCTNPQCLFPLVSRPLEDVLASLVPVEPTVGNKRKNALALEEEELIKPAHKRLRSSQLNSLGPLSSSDTLIGQSEHAAVKTGSNGQYASPKTDGEKVNAYYTDPPVAGTKEQELPQDEDDVLDKTPGNVACKDSFSPLTCSDTAGHLQCSSDASLTADSHEAVLSPHCGAAVISEVEDDLRQVKSPLRITNKSWSPDSNKSFCTNKDVDSTETHTPSPQYNEQTASTGQTSLNNIYTCEDIGGIKSQSEDLSTTTITELEELVPVPNRLFWTNSDSLCWLDSLLVALVNCKSLRKCKLKDEPRQSSVWQLMREYDNVCAAIQVHQQTGRDGIVRVPSHVLQKANTDLQSLRTSIFKLLQPKLQCKLGQRETPVFAMPLLLTMDSWAEPLFQSTFSWEFKCGDCKTATKERVMKTLPTFTNILPEWRPLHAVHSAPCNVCRSKNQRRTMTLERVPPVFGLHFVEGLPDNDAQIYGFSFEGKRYSVTTVIQYNQQMKHFITWVSNSDGSWLEYDDLKHPACKTHGRLPVPAQEMHVVFWEVEEDKGSRVCSPSSTFVESSPSETVLSPSLRDKDLAADELMVPDLKDDCSVMDTTVTDGVDTSIGSTMLLDTFEGLCHSDIITLTLVELKADSEMQPLTDSRQSQDVSAPNTNVIADSTPDSSSTVTEREMSPDVELPTTSNSSESEGGSSTDPTYVPSPRSGRWRVRGVGRGKAGSRQVGKNAVSSKAALNISPPASSEPSEVKPAHAAAQENTPPAESAQQASPVSSTDTTPQSASQESPTVPSTLDQSARWSFLVSKHPLHQVQKSVAEFNPARAAHVKPAAPAHSTPNPVRKQQVPGGFFPKPQLKTEEGGGLPPKAAEMYGAFGAKNGPSPLSTAAPLVDKSKVIQPLTSNLHKSLPNFAALSGASVPVHAAKVLPEISSSKKHGSQSSKLPPGLSETDALRYKLLKKLKAKKKKLAKLNKMLGQQGGASLRPDSTDRGSPSTVTSSTYDGSICDDLLSDLLSPATTASNLSPDSTDFLEMLASGQDGVEQLDGGNSAAGAASQMDACVMEPSTENFLEDFLSQAVAERPTEMESEALSALEIYV